MNNFLKSVFVLFFVTCTHVESNDFPTQARSEFVFACMSSNESNRDLWQNVHALLTK